MYETQWIRFCYKYKYIFPLSEPSIARPAWTRLVFHLVKNTNVLEQWVLTSSYWINVYSILVSNTISL